MDTTVTLLLTITLSGAGLLVLAVLACRTVMWAKRSSKGAEFLGTLIGSADVGTALNPAQEVLREKARVKQVEEDAGPPDKSSE
jgi:hypothetical protein